MWAQEQSVVQICGPQVAASLFAPFGGVALFLRVWNGLLQSSEFLSPTTLMQQREPVSPGEAESYSAFLS